MGRKSGRASRPLGLEPLENRELLSVGIWITPEEIMRLPASGPEWDYVVSWSQKDTSSPLISNQDDNTDQAVLAKALVGTRLGNQTMLNEVRTAVMAAVETENGGRALALARNLGAYVVAADIVGLSAQDDAVFRSWLVGVRYEVMSDGRNLVQTHDTRPNNWGNHAGFARSAADLYLDDRADLALSIRTFIRWIGEDTSYNVGHNWQNVDWWQGDPNVPVGINKAGATKEGHNIDGVLPEELRRGGAFQWPPVETNYAWGGLQGAAAHAEILHRAGYPAWQWGDDAIKRAVVWLYDVAGWDASQFGDDEWTAHLVNARTGTSYALQPTSSPGKNMGFTQWTHRNIHPVDPPAQSPPVVNAGPDQTVAWAAPASSASLNGAVSDDGLPVPAAVTVTWSLVQGPGQVNFGSPTSPSTSVTFSASGIYTLRLTAFDGQLSASDDVVVTVNRPPVVNAGPDQNAAFNTPISLNGTVSDDGLPALVGAVAVTWSLVQGPGQVSFGSPTSPSTSVTFSASGVYTLRLRASDGHLSASDDVVITVNLNRAPLVNAGPDKILNLDPKKAEVSTFLSGTVTDDGLPTSPGFVTTLWRLESGPGTVTFSSPTSLKTTATFKTTGDYLIALEAFDGELKSIDYILISVRRKATSK